MCTPASDGPASTSRPVEPIAMRPTKLKFNLPPNNASRRHAPLANLSKAIDRSLNTPDQEQFTSGSCSNEAFPSNSQVLPLVPTYTWKDQTIGYVRSHFPKHSTRVQATITQVWLEKLEKHFGKKAGDVANLESRTVAYHVRELLRQHPVAAHVKEMRFI